MSNEIKYKKSETISLFIYLINKFNFNSSSSFALRADLIELMLKNKKYFKAKEFKNISKICWRVSKNLLASNNIHGAITILEIGEKVDKKRGEKKYIWRLHIARLYEKLLENSKKNHNLSSMHFCFLASCL